MKVLNGSELASFIKERQAHQVRSLKQKPKLLIIRDSNNPVIMKYVNLKIKYGEDIGINVVDICANVSSRRSGAWQGEVERAVPVATGDGDALREEIVRANGDPSVTGIIIQLPLTDKSKTEELCNLIAPEKDIDGLGTHAKYDSATATAILWLLAGYDVNLNNQKIAIVGRGKLVGAPLFKMLTNSDYQVELFHRGSDLTKLKQFDIIITATGVPGLISDDMIKPGAVIVDAGTASEDGILKGDVANDVRDRQDLTAITPIKGGVGPMTIASLYDHLLQATTATL